MINNKIVDNLILFFLSILVIIFLSYDSHKLGFFADDISIIGDLSKINDITQLREFNLNFDAGRELQPLWMLIFIKISSFIKIEFLHLIQIIIYLINSYLLFLILKSLDINKKNSVILTFYFLLFPLYSEVIFWAHNISMTLTSSMFFLIFFYLNIIQYKKHKTILKNEFYIILFSILSIFTYEQYIYAIFLIILLRIFLKKKLALNKKDKLILLVHTAIVVIFSLYKLSEIKDLAVAYNSSLLQFIMNIIISLLVPIKTVFLSDYSIRSFTPTIFIIIIFGIMSMYYFLKNNEYKIKENKKLRNNIFIKIILCFMLYLLALIPIYFHHISPRHFYLPSIFIIITAGICLNHNSLEKKIFKIKLSKYAYLLIILSIMSNALNLNYVKYSQVANYIMKKNFYEEIIKKFDNRGDVSLINFPLTYKKAPLFAHEQSNVIKFIFKDNNLPSISIKTLQKNKIKFIDIENNKIIYEIISN